MAVPSNPKLSDVYTEFGAPTGTSLSAFLRGGAWVPNTAANAGVPTALPISLSWLAGSVKYTPMSVSAGNVSGSTNSAVSNDTIGSSSATVTGGLAPFTYAWTYISGDSFGISSPSTQGTSFTRPGRPPAGLYTGTYRCTVTDATSATAFKDITVTDNRI